MLGSKPFLCVVLFAFCMKSSAACLVIPPSNLANAGHFVHSTIRALSDFQAANEASLRMADAKGAIDLLSDIDVANEQLECAADEMQVYRDSSSKRIKDAVGVIVPVAKLLIALNGKAKAAIVKQLNGEQERAGDHAARMASLGTSYRQAWGLLMPATSLAFATLVEYSPGSTKGHLAISRADRDSMDRELQSHFPKVGKHGATMSQPEAAANLLWDQLNKNGWPLQ